MMKGNYDKVSYYWQLSPTTCKMNGEQIILDMLSTEKKPFTTSAIKYTMNIILFDYWEYYTEVKNVRATLQSLLSNGKIKAVKSWWHNPYKTFHVAYCIPSFIDSTQWKLNYKNRGKTEDYFQRYFCQEKPEWIL